MGQNNHWHKLAGVVLVALVSYGGRGHFLLMALTSEQLNDLVERYCDRVVDDMSKKEMEKMVYELLTDSFANESETDMEALISSIYGVDYYNKLVEEVTAA
jgi:hypothetical protein